MNNDIQKAAEALHNANMIAVLTGAGVSKESGVPTFRDALDGLWAQYDPAELATPQAFQKNPKLVWDWYEFRRGLVRDAKPNPGHFALAQIEKRYSKTTVITQNVDDLHEQAGSQQIIHLHGKIAADKCSANCKGKPTYIESGTAIWEDKEQPPRCPHCNAFIRPDVVWFGEMLPRPALEEASRISQLCDVMLVVGTSGMVTPAASLPGVARDAGATIIEVNPDHSMITPIAHIKLEGPSGQMLPQVIEALP